MKNFQSILRGGLRLIVLVSLLTSGERGLTAFAGSVLHAEPAATPDAESEAATGEPVKIVFYRPPGTSYEMEFERRKFSAREGTVGSDTTIKVRMLKFDESGVEYKWIWGKPRPQPEYIARLTDKQKELLDAYLELVEGMECHFRLDTEKGLVILNRDAMQRQFDEQLEISMQWFKENYGDVSPEAEQFLRTYVSSLPRREELLVRIFGLMILPIGEELVPGRVYSYDSEIEVPQFNAKLPTRGKKSVSSPDSEGVVTLKMEQNVDPEVARKVALEVLEKSAREIGKPMSAEDRKQVPPIAIHETMSYEIRPEIGWIFEMQYRKEVVAFDQTQHWESVRIVTGQPTMEPVEKTPTGGQ